MHLTFLSFLVKWACKAHVLSIVDPLASNVSLNETVLPVEFELFGKVLALFCVREHYSLNVPGVYQNFDAHQFFRNLLAPCLYLFKLLVGVDTRPVYPIVVCNLRCRCWKATFWGPSLMGHHFSVACILTLMILSQQKNFLVRYVFMIGTIYATIVPK